MISLTLAAGAAMPMIFVMASGQPPPEDFYWDALMAVGFVAAGGIALLPLLTARGAVRFEQSAPIATAGYELHEALSYVFAAGVLVHAAGLVLYQPVSIEYLKLSAPAYMLAGIGSACLLVALMIQSKRARRRHAHFKTWRRVHILLSWGAIVLMAWHVVGSGYYVVTALASSVLCGALLLPGLAALLRKRHIRGQAGAVVPDGRFDAGIQSARTRTVLVSVIVFWVIFVVAFAALRL